MTEPEDMERTVAHGETDIAPVDSAPVVQSEAGRQTMRVLERIRRARADMDAAEGWFRDYPDWKPDPTRASWSAALEMHVEKVVAAAMRGDEQELERRLMHVAEVTVAWLEALERRADERLQRTKYKPTWWSRLKYRVTGRI